MRVVVLALVFVCGCAGTLEELKDTKPSPDIGRTIQQVNAAVHAAGALANLICDMQTSSSMLCESLQNSWKAVQLALAEVNKLYDVWAQTGIGLELVHAAIDSVNVAMRSMNQNADTVRGMLDAYRIPPGTADREVPKPPAPTLYWPPNPYRQPLLAQAAQ